jgi:DNA-3-methyladenine glycosylase
MPHPWIDAPATEIASVARSLLGWHVRAHGVEIRLTEVEAYCGLGTDPASHAHRGRTSRNAIMFGPAGYAYVYFVFGMHWCLNVVCGAEGEAAAVLLRAGEIVAGAELAQARRGAVRHPRELARGPARLTVALGIDQRVNGTSLVDGTGPVTLAPGPVPVDPSSVVAGPRVGVAAAHDVPWRFWIAGDPTVSTYRRHVPRRRRAAAP